jgi:hypothetical protein
MAGRSTPGRAEPGPSLTVLDRLAPPPPASVLADRIERQTAPGDVVLDLHGRGGWVARAAIDRQRRAISLESGPLTRLVAELVLRPPDVRHLDAAFQSLGASPKGETSLRLAIGALFATRCPTCGRALIADELTWEPAPDDRKPLPTHKHYRCTVCRDQQGGGELRHAPVDDEDVERARAGQPAAAAVRRALRERFPVPDDARPLVDDLLDLHTDRQLLGLAWILERVEGDLRAEPIEAALRLTFLHAVLPASRLAGAGARTAPLKVAGGRLRAPTAESWRERNPWLALEDGFRAVRTFVQRIGGDAFGPLQARFGDDLRSLADGPTTAVVRVSSHATLRAFAEESADVARRDLRPRVRLAIGQPPRRPSPERVALAFHGTAWALGRDAAATLPVESLGGTGLRAPWGWQTAALRRTLEAVEPLVARDGRIVLLLEDGGAEPLVAAALGGAAAGYRLVDARLGDAGERPGAVEFLPPGASLPPGPRTRANVPLSPVPGGPGDPDLVPGRGLFAAPERIDARPFSAADAARTVTETATEVLKARGEPAPFDRLLAEILVGLDRAGQLRRLASAAPADDRPDSEPAPSARPPGEAAAEPVERSSVRGDRGGRLDGGETAPGRSVRDRAASAEAASTPVAVPVLDQVERLVGLIRDELTRPGQRRLLELEPDRWWLADRDDRLAAATPLADRVEWAVYSLLSTAGGMSEAAFLERIAGLFGGYDLPDEGLVRACLDSYRSPAATRDRLDTQESLVERSAQQTELLAGLVEGGHRLGMEVWLGPREQARRAGGAPLGERLTERERSVHLPIVARGPVEELEQVDAIWYVRGRLAFAFEVEWTAMLGDLLLRRHARIPPDERLVRFLVVPPERTELVRHKLDRSPLLRAAMEEQAWHVLKWNHLRTFLAGDPLALDALEPLLGLDPVVERTGEQLPLFAEGR